MFKFGRKKKVSATKPVKRPFRMTCERLEERWVPDARADFATEFKAGITAASQPVGIVEGGDGNLWFTEFASNRIARITTAGVVTEFTLPAGRGPLNVAVGADNMLYFTMNSGDRIGRLNPAAGSTAAIQASIVEFVVPGTNNGVNDIIAGPDGALWFTQSGSDQIGRITVAGVVTEFAVPGVGSAPSGICVGPDGALWFTEGGSGQIGRITTAGSITEFTVPTGVGGFSDPEDITAGPGGHLYFTDFGRSQIGRITTAGEIFQFSLPANRGPHDIVAGQDGAIYFTEAASSRIGRIPASALSPGKATSGHPPLNEYDYMAFDDTALGITSTKSGDLWFTHNNSSAVTRFKLPLTQITATATGQNVEVFDIKLNSMRTFQPYPGFSGQVTVAIADVTGDNTPDVITAAALGGGPHIKVFDGFDNELLSSFFAYDPSFRGGVFLAADYVNTDAKADIIVAPQNGAQRVKVIDSSKLTSVTNGVINDSALLGNFFAFAPGFTGGVTLGAGDLNGDNLAELILGSGPGETPLVKIVDASKLTQVQSNGTIADSALLANFLAYDPAFRGGVFVAAGYENGDNTRDVIIGAGQGGGPHVKIINGTKLSQATGGIPLPNSALFTSFFAFGANFRGGVRVSADDLNADGQTEVILSAGPGGGPHVKVINATGLTQVGSDGVIANSALLSGFFTEAPTNTNGVFIASDADHRDGPIFGPPGITVSAGRMDINDIFAFQSPVNPNNSVLTMTVSPFSTATTPNSFSTTTVFDYRIASRDVLNVTDDLVFRVAFGPPDAAANNQQDVSVRALPASRFAGSGGVVVKGFTGQNLSVRGAAGTGAQFLAAEQDDSFVFDAAGLNVFLSGGAAKLSDGKNPDTKALTYPRGTSNNGAGDSNANGLGFDAGEPDFDYNATNFFSNANTLAMTFEIPSALLVGLPVGSALTPEDSAIGFWGRSEFNGVQVDRMGRPGINTALIPPVPRASPALPGQAADRRNEFNAIHPRDDRALFGADVTGILASVYPIGGNGQAPTVMTLVLPDILVFDPTSKAGFFGDTVGTLGQADFFLAGGRKLSDDIISTVLAVLTDPDTPFNLDGGTDTAPLVATQNVADDNGMNLTDGSTVGPGTSLAGMVRSAVFPYIGARNPNPSPVPGAPIPP